MSNLNVGKKGRKTQMSESCHQKSCLVLFFIISKINETRSPMHTAILSVCSDVSLFFRRQIHVCFCLCELVLLLTDTAKEKYSESFRGAACQSMFFLNTQEPLPIKCCTGMTCISNSCKERFWRFVKNLRKATQKNHNIVGYG